MIVLHHLKNSRSTRIVWMLEELKVPYEIKVYDRVDGRAPPAYTKLSPLGKSPIVVDDGVTYIESAAILEHLVRKYGPSFKPSEEDVAELEKYELWMHFSEASLMPFIWASHVLDLSVNMTPIFFRYIVRQFVNGIKSKYLSKETFLNLDYIDNHLASNEYFAGEQFTAADPQMCFPIFAAQRDYLSQKPYKNIKRWMRVVSDRPACRIAAEKVEDNTLTLFSDVERYSHPPTPPPEQVRSDE
ncbi:Glutathione S-transferase Gst3 [Schizosaccharomyces pombe]|uniref:Glutathione S-transferase 3 n=1 Tax=Schizosaccharomyces pombe (strain 972 / ATCC 24843) TaxID=284812 RepID=GST3_SCHPO|nr:glutathione S-transferase Gst3 [Schizosaccharomyces pombe]Q9P6M1.3 RecName: Full=Glutathione S-transferase 3; AltName: Full=GST-III [Schizosaccharomyces pombe 972h-]AAK58430.1 glutathione S-transferase 3 [Schizosaccharomyces pombe]CAB90771.3 glutathione S-transferase Gst3 [Schizosaccharomyces pombe]|eukprot:NP_594063.3 glutathione S-transferase Gst3 [Schizosaccharomyces pombe]